MRINRKYLPIYTVPDCINYFFTSNHPDAFFLDDHDRRFFVHEVTVEPLGPEFYDEYDKWYRGDGAAALFDYFLNMDFAGFNPSAPAMKTEAREDMVFHVRSDLSSWVHGLIEDPESYLSPLGRGVAEKCDLFSSQQLLTCYKYQADNHGNNATANGLGRELRRCSISQVLHGRPCRTSQGLQRLYAVRNREKWKEATHQHVVEHFNAHFPAMPVAGRKF
jgi:hypothetical protein